MIKFAACVGFLTKFCSSSSSSLTSCCFLLQAANGRRPVCSNTHRLVGLDTSRFRFRPVLGDSLSPCQLNLFVSRSNIHFFHHLTCEQIQYLSTSRIAIMGSSCFRQCMDAVAEEDRRQRQQLQLQSSYAVLQLQVTLPQQHGGYLRLVQSTDSLLTFELVQDQTAAAQQERQQQQQQQRQPPRPPTPQSEFILRRCLYTISSIRLDSLLCHLNTKGGNAKTTTMMKSGFHLLT